MKLSLQVPKLVVSDIHELNAGNSASFRDEVRAALTDGVTGIDVNLSQTHFVDSSGLGALISLHKTMCGRGGAVRIVSPTAVVRQILELTRLHRVFEIANH